MSRHSFPDALFSVSGNSCLNKVFLSRVDWSITPFKHGGAVPCKVIQNPQWVGVAKGKFYKGKYKAESESLDEWEWRVGETDIPWERYGCFLQQHIDIK